MDDIDAIVERVLKEMGCDTTKPPYWIPRMYKSVAGNHPFGYICSHCGKHSWSKRTECDGCGAVMPKGE